MPTRADIEDFLAQRSIAVVGVSRDPKHFANAVARHLDAGGRTVHWVHPAVAELDGHTCHHSVLNIPGPLDGVLVMVNAEAAEGVVREALARGVTRIWLHKGAGAGAVSPEAVALCREAGARVVDGACPLMYAEPVAWFHRFHRTLHRPRAA